MEIISIDELHDQIDKLGDDQLVLDVRSAEEFQEGHIKNAQNTPHDQVNSITEQLEGYKTVYIHCKMGGRAQMATKTLEAAGLTNIICIGNGGMQRWQEQGWPVE